MGQNYYHGDVSNRLNSPGILTGTIAGGDRPANPGGKGWIFIDQVLENIYSYSTDLSAWVLIGSGLGGGVVSGSGITVTAGVVNLGRTAVALNLDANLVTTGGKFIFINPDADGSKLDFDQVNFNTYVNGGAGNTGTTCGFFGLGSGRNQTGSNVMAFGFRSLRGNTKNGSTAFGGSSGDGNTGTTFSGFGYRAGDGNTGNNANCFGYQSGIANTLNNVFLFGNGANATNANQVVFSMANTAYLSFTGISGTRDYNFLDESGNVALLKDGSGLTATATRFNLGGSLIQATNIDQSGFDMTIFGNNVGINLDITNKKTTIGDISAAGNSSMFSVADDVQSLDITANLVTNPGVIAPTGDYIKILISGIQWYIPLYI